MQEVSYVIVPCDNSEPIQELRMSLPPGEEVEAFLNKLKKHFGSTGGTKTAAQRQAQKEALIQQVGDEAARKLSADLWETALNMNMVENISLLGNSPETGFVGVNMYCDDEGAIKGLPLNPRASDIARCCGKMLEVRGDVFLGRVFDNEDEFKRMDLTASEVSSSAPWVRQAAQIAARKANEESAQSKLDRLQQGAGRGPPSTSNGSGDSAVRGPVAPADVEREKGNTFFKRGRWEDAIGCYSAAIKLDASQVAAYNNRAMAYLKLQQWQAALDDCGAVLEREARNVKAMFRQACALEGLGRQEEAVANLRLVLTLQPQNKEAQEMMRRLEGEGATGVQ